MNPLVTVAIPTYNRVELLRQSLASALAQTYPNLEILVSDNGSTDETEPYMHQISDPRVRYIRQPKNLGMVGNWNACLEQTEGEYFLLLSDDDLLEPTGIAELMAIYKQVEANSPSIAFCYGRVEPFGHPFGSFPLPKQPQAIEQTQDLMAGFLLQGRPTFACSMLFRRPLTQPEFRYDDSYKLLFDADFWMRQAQLFQVVRFVSHSVAKYRFHPQSESSLSSRLIWAEEMDRLIESRLKEGSIDTPTAQLARFLNHARERTTAKPYGLDRLLDLVSVGRTLGVSKWAIAKYLLKHSVPNNFYRWIVFMNGYLRRAN